ncbi:MAG: hypothetical protein VX254_08210, partial [Planctomycetota bacterium]|nr:hypothetical protein [Planctomycetota bacterium]
LGLGDLVDGGVEAGEFLQDDLAAPVDLFNAGIDAGELLNAGVDVDQMAEAGVGLVELFKAGANAEELLGAGAEAAELIAAGIQLDPDAGIFPVVLNGDLNGDSGRDISDAVYLLTWLFQGGPEPADAGCAAGDNSIRNGDANGDLGRDISDATYLLRWLFHGGNEPAAIECGAGQ